MATKANTTDAAWTPVGRGMAYSIVNGELLVRVPIGPDALAAATPSASGKTRVIGSTQGNVKIAGTDVTMGLNVYTKA